MWVLVATALVWALATMGMAVAAIVRRRQQRRETPIEEAPEGTRVLLVRPCCGAEPELERCLCSAALARRSFAMDVVLSVNREGEGAWASEGSLGDDAALPTLHRASKNLRAAGLGVSIQAHPVTGENRKVTQLSGVLREQGDGYPVILFADSNVDLTNFDLDRLVVPLLERNWVALSSGKRERAGARWAAFSEVSVSSDLGSRASVALLGGGMTAFALLCGLVPRALVGKLWAARADAIKEVGGMQALAGYLGEDFEMARRLIQGGWGIDVVGETAVARVSSQSLIAVVERMSRWICVIWAQRPWLMLSYPAFFFSTSLLCGLAGIAVCLCPSPSAAQVAIAGIAVCLAVAVRVGVAIAAQIFSGRGLSLLRLPLDVLLADFVVLIAWCRVLVSREFDWRGQRLRIDCRGRLVAVHDSRRSSRSSS